jgi:hypothetical protein
MTHTTSSSRVRIQYRTRGRGRRVALGLVAIVLTAVACTARQYGETYQQRLDDWQVGGITSYVWTLETSEPIFGARRVTVRVEDGEPVEAVAKGKTVAIEGSQANNMPATVDALIGWLVRYAEDAKSVQVQWNEHAGYPTLIELDHSAAIDDEITFRVISFKALG